MPAYSFLKQFAQPIVEGTKGGTIRPTRGGGKGPRRVVGGHAWPGETLYLFTGMRTKYCRRIGDRPCLKSASISLHLGGHPRVEIHDDDDRRFYAGASDLDKFAVFDGFPDWAALREFWAETHRAVTIFDGWHVRWLPLP